MSKDTDWWVYMLTCSDGSLYTGITTDVARRVKEHNGEGLRDLGSKYTKARRPVVLAYKEKAQDRSAASKREAEIKKLPKVEKNKLLH